MYIPSSAGWSSQKASWGTSAAGRGHLRLNCTREYNSTTNKSKLTFYIEAYSGYYDGTFMFQGGDTVKVNGTAVATLDNTYSVALYGSGDSTFRQVKKNNTAQSWTTSWLSHNESGVLSVPIKLDLTLFYTVSGVTYVLRWTDSYTFTATEPRASTISSVTNPASTNGTIQVEMLRNSSAYYHKATLTYNGNTLYTSAAFATSLSIPVARSWFNSYPYASSLSCTLSVQTYTNSSCTTAMGSPATAAVTVKPDAGMAPVLAAGFATVAPYNTGTGAAGVVDGYVSGVSKAQVTIDNSKLTLANNATLSSVTVNGVTASGTPKTAITGVLNGTATITVIATDSRGLSATQTLTVQTMQYAGPTIGGVEVFRCDSLGAQNEGGSYFSVKGTANFTSLVEGGVEKNGVTLTAAYAEGTGSYGAETTLTSGIASVIGSVNPDKTLSVRLTATDNLGKRAEAYVTLPQQRWAMKFFYDDATGDVGVAFGMKATEANVLQLPPGWKIKIGSTTVAHD